MPAIRGRNSSRGSSPVAAEPPRGSLVLWAAWAAWAPNAASVDDLTLPARSLFSTLPSMDSGHSRNGDIRRQKTQAPKISGAQKTQAPKKLRRPKSPAPNNTGAPKNQGPPKNQAPKISGAQQARFEHASPLGPWAPFKPIDPSLMGVVVAARLNPQRCPNKRTVALPLLRLRLR